MSRWFKKIPDVIYIKTQLAKEIRGDVISPRMRSSISSIWLWLKITNPQNGWFSY